MSTVKWVMQGCGLVAVAFVAALGVLIIWRIANKDIDLKYLICESSGQASMSRLQLLIFTFVIAIGFFELVQTKGAFPDVGNGVLTLLGISASTYAVGKGISASVETASMAGDDTAQSAANAAVAQAAATQAAVHAATAQSAAARSTVGAVVSGVAASAAEDSADRAAGTP